MYIRHILPEPELGVLPPDPLNAALTGVVNGTLQLALQQAASGHEVEMIAPTEAPTGSTAVIGGVRIHWLPVWKRFQLPNYDLRYLLPSLLFNLRARRADITHVHDNPFLLMVVRSRAAVMHHHGLILRGSPMYDRMERRARRVICISDHIRGELTRQVEYPPEQVVTVHDGIHCEAFTSISRSEARTAFGLQENEFAILFAGRVAPEKGLHVLLEALQKPQPLCLPDGRKPVLLVAGTTRLGYSQHTELDKIRPDLTPYEQKIQALSAGLQVRFVGNVGYREMAQFYRAGDLFVCPSVWQEAFGRINIEAMAAGMPIIASRVGGIPEVVQDEVNGLLVPPEDAASLRQALDRLLSDEPLRQQFIQQGQSLIHQFEWTTLAKRVDQIYQAVLDELN